MTTRSLGLSHLMNIRVDPIILGPGSRIAFAVVAIWHFPSFGFPALIS